MARPDAITSRGNTWLKRLRRAGSRGTVTANGSVLAESPHLLQEALRSEVEIERVFASERVYGTVVRQLPPHRRIPLHPVVDRLFPVLSTTSHNQGVLSLVRLPSWDAEAVFAGLTVVLDGVQDPGNAGAIVRSAAAFGASGVLFLKGSASPHNPKTLRASAGALFRLPFLHRVGAEEFLDLARRHGKTVQAAVAHGGQRLRDRAASTDSAVVVGSETHGINPRLLRNAVQVSIPTVAVESLNAAVAAGIVLYESARARKL